MEADSLAFLFSGAVQLGYTITISPLEGRDQPCGIMFAKDGEVWTHSCAIEADKISSILHSFQFIWLHKKIK